MSKKKRIKSLFTEDVRVRTDLSSRVQRVLEEFGMTFDRRRLKINMTIREVMVLGGRQKVKENGEEL